MSPTVFLPLPFAPLLFSVLPFLSSLLLTSVSADKPYLQNCQPKSCGNLINVSFPFWFQNLQPDYCGYPAFELRCEDGTPKLSMPEEDYHVLNISYEKRTVNVLMERFASMDTCRLPYYNVSFGLTPFTISSLNRELVFVYNCSAEKPGFLQINCHNNRSYAYLGGTYHIEESEGLFGSCFSVVMPVLSSPEPEVKKYPELLADGFLLNWTAPDCSECVKSNGQCGYNNDTRNFMCICPDRPHWKSCCKSSATIWFVMFF
ncbi:hypothetical protein IEQ34_017303 [Dendrobium chrysotoxum]|uniref:LEAF RUST 10 DISEASE-RESISTANCE LOCUS RECEPTOR-LIKE PROTEIN KINASE-like 1.2 n=1 Tax=Dendrobium chrysotoxum TaxID=161865 RepID=A0AAV7GAW0_DENCH|nr:hypothetical protein IEQ34_017303 [Dendrobium chrysotoxum]